MVAQVPTVTLNNSVQIPQLGFGVFQVPFEETFDAVTTALQTGYRHIDTAAMYENEAEVGRAIAESGIERDDVFVTTKLNNPDHGYDNVPGAIRQSLDHLGLDQVDLYLVHWPLASRDVFVDTWRGMEKVYADGLARAIGVSNFQPAHLDRLLNETDIVPAVNQVEAHPTFTQDALRDKHRQLGIATEAWAPLGQASDLDDSTVIGIADELGRTPAQVVLRWHLQLGNIVFPKSVTPSRIAANFDIFGFELSPQQVDAISALDRGNRLGPDPDTLG